MGRSGRSGLTLGDQLLVLPYKQAIEAASKIIEVSDPKDLEKYAKLHRNDPDGVYETLKTDLGIEVQRYNSRLRIKRENMGDPVLRVSRTTSAVSIRLLVTKYGYSPEQIDELRGDDLFHVTPDGKVYYRLI